MKNKNLWVMAVISLPITVGLIGCSSYHQPESIDAKMARFSPRDTNPNIVPTLPVPELDKSTHSSRMPASASAVSYDNSDSQESEHDYEMETLSHKRLYFMGLYQQYRTLGLYISQEQVPEIEHCPSFHTTLLNGKTAYRGPSKTNINFEQRYSSIDEQRASYYPELSLPMEVDSATPTLAQAIKADSGLNKDMAFQQALKVHLTKTYKELEELCDSGSSSNYYNYENLTRHIKSNHALYQTGAKPLQTLVKTTIFSNMALIESLESKTYGQKRAARGPASVSTAKKWDNLYQDHMLKDLKMSWTKKYFKEVMSKR